MNYQIVSILFLFFSLESTKDMSFNVAPRGTAKKIKSFFLEGINPERKGICEELKPIDSSEFVNNYPAQIKYDKNNKAEKQDGKIKIRFQKSDTVFEDDLTDENYFIYSIEGELKGKNITVIKGQDYNQDYYYLVNRKKETIDTLVGRPQVFNNSILAVEGAYTDGTAFIEIWKFDKGSLNLFRRFSLKECMIYNIQEAYIKDNFLYVKNRYRSSNLDYFKLGI